MFFSYFDFAFLQNLSMKLFFIILHVLEWKSSNSNILKFDIFVRSIIQFLNCFDMMYSYGDMIFFKFFIFGTIFNRTCSDRDR